MGRSVEVAREVAKGMPRFAKDAIFKELNAMSDEDLHTVIGNCRKYQFNHRLNTMRKLEPSKKMRTEMSYKLTASKFILRAREIRMENEAAENAEPKPPMTFREEVEASMDADRLHDAWAKRPSDRKWYRFGPYPSKMSDGAKNICPTYYQKKGFVPPGDMESPKPWEKETRAKHNQNGQAKPLRYTAAFRPVKTMEKIMPKPKK